MLSPISSCQLLLLSALFGSAACGASQGFRDRVFDDGTVRYRVGVLDGRFERIDVGDNDLAWHDPTYGTVSVNSTCTEYEDVPARALMNQLLMGTTERAYQVEETVTVDGRAAQHVIADVELDGVPVRINVYLLVKDGCVFDLMHVGARDRNDHAQPVFERFVSGFAVLQSKIAHAQK
jgi:hypothetical protein